MLQAVIKKFVFAAVVVAVLATTASAQTFVWPGQNGNAVGFSGWAGWAGSFNATACGSQSSGTNWSNAAIIHDCTYSTSSHTTVSCNFCMFVNVDFKSTATADNDVLVSGSNVLFLGDRFQSNCLQCANVSAAGNNQYYIYSSFTPLVSLYTSPPGSTQWPGAGAGANTRTITSGVNAVADNQGYEIGLFPNNGKTNIFADHCDLWGYGNAIQIGSSASNITLTSNYIHDTASPNVTGGQYHSDGIGYLNGAGGPSNVTVIGNATGMMGNTQAFAYQAATSGYSNMITNVNFWSGDNTTVAWCRPGSVQCTNSTFYGNVFGTDIMDDGAVYNAGGPVGSGSVWACNRIEFLAGTTWTNLDGWTPTSGMNNQFFIDHLPPNSATDQGSNTVCAITNPPALAWTRQTVNTSSTSRTVTLTSTNSGTLSGISIALATGTQFSQSNNCGSSLTSGNSCTITVTFTPTAYGPQTDTLQITDNSTGVTSPQPVPLIGIGSTVTDVVAPPPAPSPALFAQGQSVVTGNVRVK